MPSRLTVLSGPSGVGKGTVVAAVRELYPHVWVSVSCTTRPPRPGEVDGVQYRFVDRPTFEAMARRGELLEHAEFAGNLYGTPRAPVHEHLAAGMPTLLDIELQGARQVQVRPRHQRGEAGAADQRLLQPARRGPARIRRPARQDRAAGEAALDRAARDQHRPHRVQAV